MMFKSVFLLGFLPIVALRAEPEIEFTAVLAKSGNTTLALADKTAGTSRWVELGGSFAGYRVLAYDAKSESAVLEKDAKQIRLRLTTAKVQHAPDTMSPETKDAIMRNLQQIVSAANRFYLENARVNAKLADLVGPDKALKELVPVAGEKYDALPLTLATRSFSVTTAAGVGVTYESTEPPVSLREYIVRAGDTYSKIARDVGIPWTQLAEMNATTNPTGLKVGQKLRLK